MADSGVAHNLSRADAAVGHSFDHFAPDVGNVSHLGLHVTNLALVLILCQAVPTNCVNIVQL